MLNVKSAKTQLVIFLIAFALYLSIKDRNFTFLSFIFVASCAAFIFDGVFSYFKNRHFAFSDSAIITGLIIGYVISPDEGYLKLVFASFIAILSKYSIRYNNKHIFNPAALGIIFTIIVFGAYTSWRGTYIWYILVPFGLYFAYRYKKIEIILGYFAVSLFLFVMQAVLQGNALVNILGYFSYFFIFIMMIEPKTSPVSLKGKYIFGALIAVLIFVFTKISLRIDVELLSLLLVNTAVYFLNKIPQRKEA